MKVGLSYVSIEQARRNLDAELPHWDFDRVRRESREVWNQWLGKIEVDGGSPTQRKKFYTDLWHALLGRRLTSDVDGKYCDMTGPAPRVRQIPLDAQGRPLYNHYNSDAFWMTFWNLNQLWGIAYPRTYSEFVRFLLDMYRDGGLIPRGPTGHNYSFVMIGAHSTPLIVGAYMKGIRDFDVATAYEGMRKNHFPGGLMGHGHYEYRSANQGGIEDYLRYGYIPIDGRPKGLDRRVGLGHPRIRLRRLVPGPDGQGAWEKRTIAGCSSAGRRTTATCSTARAASCGRGAATARGFRPSIRWPRGIGARRTPGSSPGSCRTTSRA